MSRKSSQVEGYAVGAADQGPAASLPKQEVTSIASARSRQRAGASTMRVGFIGLDPIGRAMASRLLKSGHQLTLYDPARKIPEALASAGGRVANSVEDACRWSDAVFTVLSSDEATEEVILSSGGVLESMPQKAIHIGSSTVSVECSDRIVEAHWDAGREYVSAPVLVRSELEADLQLHVIAGGSDATICQVETLLSPMGQLTQLSGWPSDANLVQLGANGSRATLFQFLARHPELAGAAFLNIETKGVLQ